MQQLHGKRTVWFSCARLFSCSIAAVPRDCEHWRTRMLLVVAAGPLATLFGLAVAANAAVWAEPQSWLATFWSALAQFHFFSFVLGLIPNGESAKVRNDASLFLMLKRDGPAARELELYHRLTQLKLSAIRPYNYPVGFLGGLDVTRCRAETNLLAARTMVERALDSDEVALAELWDKRALEQSQGCDAPLRNTALAASACFDVLFRMDYAAARGKFEKVDFKALFPAHLAYRARAAYLLANGRAEKVPGQIIRAQYGLPLGLPYYDFERMLLEKLHLRSLAETYRGGSSPT
jgi:hypothetical protein